MCYFIVWQSKADDDEWHTNSHIFSRFIIFGFGYMGTDGWLWMRAACLIISKLLLRYVINVVLVEWNGRYKRGIPNIFYEDGRRAGEGENKMRIEKRDVTEDPFLAHVRVIIKSISAWMGFYYVRYLHLCSFFGSVFFWLNGLFINILFELFNIYCFFVSGLMNGNRCE